MRLSRAKCILLAALISLSSTRAAAQTTDRSVIPKPPNEATTNSDMSAQSPQIAASGSQNNKGTPGKADDGSTSDKPAANQTTYVAQDAIAQKADGSLLWEPSGTDLVTAFRKFIDDQSNGEQVVQSLQSGDPKVLPSDALSPRNVLIVHVVIWSQAPNQTYQPQKGAWAFYRMGKDGRFNQDVDASGTPYLYNAPKIYLIDMNYFDEDFIGGQVTFGYKINTTPRQKQNAADVATLANTILKLKAATKKQPQVWGTVTTVTTSSAVPYDLSITASIAGSSGHDKYISCDPSPCSFSKTIAVYDPEYWDVSLGITVPGVLEGVYKTGNNSGAIPTASPTRHTDAYAFVDVYPFQHFANAPATFTYIPHFNFGIPITGQPLHRPYVGMAENLSFLTKRIKLNLPLAVYAGPVFMKQQIYDTRSASLKWDHAIKGLYGIELPISAITNYMKGGSSSSKGGNASTSSKGGS